MIPVECKIDNFGLLYLDEEYIFRESLHYYDTFDKIKARFYKIDSTNEYVIKYHLSKLNRREIYRMLLNFYSIKGNKLINIDFPIGYYKERSKIKGLIIPNYPNSISLRHALINENLEDFYNHSVNKKDNIVLLLQDIFKILEDLYNNGIIYTDVNPGNFVLYQNEIKIIDFDPDYLFYDDNDNYYLKKMLVNYQTLVNYVCRKYEMNLYDICHFDSNISDVKKYMKIK